MVTKQHPLITTVPWCVYFYCSWHRMHILLFIPEKLSPKKFIPSSRWELGGRKSVSWCNNNLTLLWLVLFNIYTITFCVRIKEAETAFLFLSLYLSGHQIFHCCPPWRLLGHGPLHLRSLLPFSISISSEIIKFFITALPLWRLLGNFKFYWQLYITLIIYIFVY